MSHLMTKPTKWHVRPAKTQFSLGIRPVWSESPLSAWRKLGSLATHWAHSEDFGVFAVRIVTLLVLSWGGSTVKQQSRRPAKRLAPFSPGEVIMIDRRELPVKSIKPSHHTTRYVKDYVARHHKQPYKTRTTPDLFFWFDFCFTALQHTLGHFGRGQLT